MLVCLCLCVHVCVYVEVRRQLARVDSFHQFKVGGKHLHSLGPLASPVFSFFFFSIINLSENLFYLEKKSAIITLWSLSYNSLTF